MGIECQAYIGPFAVCRNTIIEDTVTIRCCNSDPVWQCEKRTVRVYDPDVNFCPVCGAAIAETSIPQKRKLVKVQEITEALQDRLMETNEYGFSIAPWEKEELIDVWICNMRGHAFGRSLNPQSKSFCFIPSQQDPEKTKATFEAEYADEIAHLREAYGPESVKIEWGFLNWMS